MEYTEEIEETEDEMIQRLHDADLDREYDMRGGE